MARTANLLGLVIGGALVLVALVLVGLLFGLVAFASASGFGLGVGLLLATWGGILVLICGSNLRRSRGATRA